MSTIRTSIFRRIQENLNRPPLLIDEDFRVLDRQYKSHVSLRIIYNLQPDKYFEAKILTNKLRKIEDNASTVLGVSRSKVVYEYKIDAEFRPGEISQNETTTLTNSDELLEAVESWVNRLVEEIYNEPIGRQIEQQQQQLNELEELVNQIADEMPTIEEVLETKNYLENLIKDLKSSVDELKSKDEEQASKIEELASLLESLSQRVESTSKRNLFRAILVRFYTVASDPKLAQFADNAKKFIGLLGGSPE